MAYLSEKRSVRWVDRLNLYLKFI